MSKEHDEMAKQQWLEWFWCRHAPFRDEIVEEIGEVYCLDKGWVKVERTLFGDA